MSSSFNGVRNFDPFTESCGIAVGFAIVAEAVELSFDTMFDLSLSQENFRKKVKQVERKTGTGKVC